MDSEIIQEGDAKIHLKCSDNKEQKTQEDVFYNPVQVFNRDISLLVTYQYILD